MTAHPVPVDRPCTHRNYLLDCPQFDQLVIDAGNQCRICRQVGGLVIDHDHDLGPWAVRGLLCYICNIRLGQSNATSDAARQYLAAPWHATMLARLGVAFESAEPPTGATVVALRTTWTRKGAKWRRYTGESETWAGLIYRYGPHNLIRNDELGAAFKDLAAVSRTYKRADSTCREAGKAAMDKAIQLLRAGQTPAEVTRLSPFTDAYIRRAARAAGIPAARHTGYAKTKEEQS